MAYVWVAIGGALGSAARYGMSGVIANLTGGVFPYGTLFVNVTGGILIGFLATISGPDSRFIIPTAARIFMMTGICGGYTTFSTFSLETVNLMREGDWMRAAANVIGSVVLCLIAVMAGHAGALFLNRVRGG
ncbi:MAG: fluoride efflux transporter CrcB [Candidatus Binataceae bacterium]|nr:fluoride efflux transporter CrcB [Candidatus Binataceae bacterium]